MLINKVHPITGEVNAVDLPITREQLSAWRNGVLVQDAFPNLDSDQREFLVSGILPGEFEKICGKAEE